MSVLTLHDIWEIYKIIRKRADNKKIIIRNSLDFEKDLNIDSIKMIEIEIDIEGCFGFKIDFENDEMWRNIKTVIDLVEYINFRKNNWEKLKC